MTATSRDNGIDDAELSWATGDDYFVFVSLCRQVMSGNKESKNSGKRS